ncbi:MAG: hypothetical protein M1540_05840 [Candidatus Bathyarchaeota archaeon]|nr:hypothetical protein [Candidatus Bathyarchaeota archaeon]
MSKSRGKVYYTSDVLTREFSGEQLRFSLIYVPYRAQLNFTFEMLLAASRKLDAVRGLVVDLQENTAASQSKRDPKAGQK